MADRRWPIDDGGSTMADRRRRWTILRTEYNRRMFVSAILAAGGRGTRLGAATPKQLLIIGDRPILQRSFETLDAHDNIHEIAIALPAEIIASPPPSPVSSRK